MGKSVEFFYDFGSPATYIAFKRLPVIAAERGAQIVWRPMLLGGVFKAAGNASPVSVPAKGKWMMGDLQRWAAKFGVPFAFNPFFPVNTLTLMRGATGLQMRQPADFARYNDAIFDAMWRTPRCTASSVVATSRALTSGSATSAANASGSKPCSASVAASTAASPRLRGVRHIASKMASL
jgi:2-hydroxychromene-2-carboxylate isomerase